MESFQLSVNDLTLSSETQSKNERWVRKGEKSVSESCIVPLAFLVS